MAARRPFGSGEDQLFDGHGRKRAFVVGLWIVTAAFVGGMGGFYIGWHRAHQTVPATAQARASTLHPTSNPDLFTAAQRAIYLSAIRTNGNDTAYENALRSNLSFLDAAKARSHDSTDIWSYTFDRALTLARLSRLAQKRGAIDEASRLAQEAEALCPGTGLRNCSASTLAEVTDKIDNGTLFDSSETPN